MLVRDYMTTELVTVQETDTLLDATMFLSARPFATSQWSEAGKLL